MTPEQEALLHAAGFKFQDLLPESQMRALEEAAIDYAQAAGVLDPDVGKAWDEACLREAHVPANTTAAQAREDMIRAMSVYALCKWAETLQVDPDCVAQKDERDREVTELDVEVFNAADAADSAIHALVTPLVEVEVFEKELLESVPPPRMPPPLQGVQPYIAEVEAIAKEYVEKMDAPPALTRSRVVDRPVRTGSLQMTHGDMQKMREDSIKRVADETVQKFCEQLKAPTLSGKLYLEHAGYTQEIPVSIPFPLPRLENAETFFRQLKDVLESGPEMIGMRIVVVPNNDHVPEPRERLRYDGKLWEVVSVQPLGYRAEIKLKRVQQ